MRLIDADKLKEYVNSKSTHPLCEWDTAGVLMAIHLQETVSEIESKANGKQTQGDKLRNMNDDKLSKFLSDTFCHGYGQPQIKEWLESEATHDHN